MMFDTDLLIWVQRGHEKAARIIEQSRSRYLSIQTYMELLQCAKSKKQHRTIKNFIHTFRFETLPLTEKIGHRAAIYVEEYTLSHNVRAADALIAATAVENNLVLVSGNHKHFKAIKDLRLKVFKP